MTTLRDWLAEEPFALGMSSGFFGFFAHCGMARALYEAKLTPARVGGASAGALVGGALAGGLDPAALAQRLLTVRRDEFWDPRPGLGWLRGELFDDRLREWLPATTFEDCSLPMSCSVFDVLGYRTRVCDSGDLVTAIRASCAVPLMFQPVWIERRPYLDGGVLDRPGLSGLADAPRVLYHHLASRSPWRRSNGAHTRIPRRDQLTALVLHELPRSGPNRLAAGALALDQAYRMTRVALDRPIAPEIHIT